MVLKKFREHTKNPEIFLTAQTARAEKIKSLLKTLYDHGQLVELGSVAKRRNASYLDELIVDEMDEEQIWQQLELKNEQLLGPDLPATSKLLSMGSKRLQLAFQSEDLEGEEDGGEEDDQEVDDEASDEEVPVSKQNGEGKAAKKGKKAKRSIVDDRFFRLDDMAKFLDEEDEREMRRQSGKPDVDPLIEVDYFSADVGEEADDSEAEDLKYSDFFDDDEEEEEEEGDDEEQEQDGEQSDASDQETEGGSGSEAEEGKPDSEEELNSEDEVERNRRLRFELYNASGDFLPGSTSKKVPIERPESSESEAEQKSEDEGVEQESPEKRADGPKSSFELRQEKLQQRIEKMENQLLDAKPWQLKGEISADTRPQNSLLEEVLEFESTTRPAPVITEETTMRLEDIIRQRIKNKAWDDVERKVRPPDNPREFRKQLVLDGEKSKESLAQIYERDYLKQLEKANPSAADADASAEEEPKEHRQIRAAMKTLLAQLDALSNFHYTPRPAVPELKILTNTPAISMEEVAPVATSDATLLAPEEVHNRPKGDVMSKDERDRADKNRERRLKKRFQREKFARQAEKEQQLLAKGIKPRGKEQQEKLLKKVSKAKNVTTMVEGRGASKSSTAFFSQLQDEVSTQIKGKLGGQKKVRKNGGATGLQATHVKL
uniref:U3 small nucleolar ribonucleoprotein protein MPP10 n=1 Tax=Culex tarsalis TaxID=7177 RepID=A0A1Q3EZ54_CULTA